MIRKDEDFKEEILPSGETVFTNLEKACEGLPEWNDCLWCYICRKPVETMKDIHFFRFEAGKDLWFKVFHWGCYMPTTLKHVGDKLVTPN